MSRKTKIVPVRFGDKLIASIDAAIAQHNENRFVAHINRSLFLRMAAEELCARLLQARADAAKTKGGKT